MSEIVTGLESFDPRTDFEADVDVVARVGVGEIFVPLIISLESGEVISWWIF